MQTQYARPCETLSVEDLGTFLDDSRVALLATLRVDGHRLALSVYHEWREGGFNVVVETQNVKARHLRRDPRATILVAESERSPSSLAFDGRQDLGPVPMAWKRAVDKDEGGVLDEPRAHRGHGLPGVQGREASDHSNAGFVIVDGSRKKAGKILVKTNTIPPEDFEAGYRGGSIINTPAVDLKRDLVFAGTATRSARRSIRARTRC